MNKLSISADSTADIEWCFEKYDIQTVPGQVIIGDKTFKDGIDIVPDDIYNAVEKQNILPKTAAGHENDYTTVFESAKGKPHLHIALSPEFSASYDNAMRAAEAFPNVTVVNSGNMSAGLGLTCIIARELASEGKTKEQVVEALKLIIPKIKANFMVDTLHYLHRGGRCSGLKLFAANLLKLHPMIYVDAYGKMLPGKKFRGKFAVTVKSYVAYVLEKNPNINKDLIIVAHTDISTDIQKQVEDDLKAAGFKNVYNTLLGCTLTTHCGRNTIGLGFRND